MWPLPISIGLAVKQELDIGVQLHLEIVVDDTTKSFNEKDRIVAQNF